MLCFDTILKDSLDNIRLKPKTVLRVLFIGKKFFICLENNNVYIIWRLFNLTGIKQRLIKRALRACFTGNSKLMSSLTNILTEASKESSAKLLFRVEDITVTIVPSPWSKQMCLERRIPLQTDNVPNCFYPLSNMYLIVKFN